MRFRYSYLIAFLLTFLLVACGSQSAGNTTVSGDWTGMLSSGTPITLKLEQSESSVTGTITVMEVPTTVSGTFASGQLSLSGRDDVGPVRIEASATATSIEGSYSAVDPATNAPVSLELTASR